MTDLILRQAERDAAAGVITERDLLLVKKRAGLVPQLVGHDSEETAYLIEDYPYGRRLRCMKRVWIETNKRGQRLVSQTSNPKRDHRWNKPKRSTYSTLLVMYLDEQDHVACSALTAYSSLEEVQAFGERYGAGFTAHQQREWEVLLACKRVGKRLTWTISTGGSDEPEAERKAREEATDERIGKAVAVELVKVRKEVARG